MRYTGRLPHSASLPRHPPHPQDSLFQAPPVPTVSLERPCPPPSPACAARSGGVRAGRARRTPGCSVPPRPGLHGENEPETPLGNSTQARFLEKYECYLRDNLLFQPTTESWQCELCGALPKPEFHDTSLSGRGLVETPQPEEGARGWDGQVTLTAWQPCPKANRKHRGKRGPSGTAEASAAPCSGLTFTGSRKPAPTPL